VGTAANRDAIGGALHYTCGEQKRLFLRNGGGSYLSQSDTRMLLTWPEGDRPAEVLVRWPGGREETFPFPAAMADNVWVEGSRSGRGG
jgi:hypothetical protein